jgi:O-antigen/teichoic acid export membrane protein
MVNKQDQKEISKGLNLLVKSSVVVFFGLLFSKVFAYLYRILIARYYGPEVYGLFSLALMVLGLFIAFASLGLSEGLLRFIPIYKVKKDSRKIFFLINFSKKALLFSGSIAAILLFFSSGFIATRIFNEPQLSIFLKVFAFLIPIQLFSNIYLSIIRANERIGAFSFGFNILQNAIKFLFILIFIFFISKAVFAVTFSYSLGILSVLLFSYFYCRFKLPSLLFEKGLSKQSQ